MEKSDLALNITRNKHDDTQEIKVINRVGSNKSENLLLDMRAHSKATAAGRFDCFDALLKFNK